MDLNKRSISIIKFIHHLILACIIPFIIHYLTGWVTLPLCILILIYGCGIDDDIFNYITKNKYNEKRM